MKKKPCWAVSGIVLFVTVATIALSEKFHANSQDVTIIELLVPEPASNAEQIVLLDVLNSHFQTYGLPEVSYFQGFEFADTGNRIVAGNFNHSQFGKVRKQLTELARKSPDVSLNPISERRILFRREFTFQDNHSLTLNAAPDETPIETIVRIGPDSDPLKAHFYDGHTILFARPTDGKLRILFITVISPPETTFQRLLEFIGFDWKKVAELLDGS